MMPGKRTRTVVVLVAIATATAMARPPHYDHWTNIDKQQGLPSDKVFCVHVTEDLVWIGTDKGAARYDGSTWRTLSTKEGLAHRAVMGIADDPDSGDVWFATMGGLSRYSAGRIDTYTQLNSGLANNPAN